VPAFPLKASTPGLTKNLDIRMKNNGTHMLLNFGDNSFRANFNDPILQRALVGINSNYEKARNVWNVGPAKRMRAVISNYDNAPHPVSALCRTSSHVEYGTGRCGATATFKQL
jgi:hypothetical protein